MVLHRARRYLGAYLAFFFVAVSAAPHHHLNGLQDLLLDQRSDSGEIVQEAGSVDASSGPILAAASIVPDVPCPACFTGDFVCNPTALFQFVADLAPLPLKPRPPAVTTPALLPAESSSRSPPRAA